MKLTAFLPTELLVEIKKLLHEKCTMESIMKMFSDWRSIQKIKFLNFKILKNPLVFKENFTADAVRQINREKI